VLTNNPVSKQPHEVAPSDFRVVAFMAAYNEEDIIVQSIKKWTIRESACVFGKLVHRLNLRVGQKPGRSVAVTVEGSAAGPSPYFDGAPCCNVSRRSRKRSPPTGFVRRGADEVLVPPWPGVSYRDASISWTRRASIVWTTIVEFHPVDDEFQTGMDHEPTSGTLT